ncbi:unnamed protein product [Pedinophyceae sp. YPF-701]|nr:unnamed protein product [Pedinophyceae sp. YPF-701]
MASIDPLKGLYASINLDELAEVLGASGPDNAPLSRDDLLDVVLRHSSQPLAAPMTKLIREHAEKALRMNAGVVEYCGDTSGGVPSQQESHSIVYKLMNTVLKRTELVDELYLQLLRHARSNPNADSLIRAWKLMAVLCASSAPGKDKISAISEYIHAYCSAESEPKDARAAAIRAFQMLKRSAKAHARKHAPSPQEIAAFQNAEPMPAFVHFLDDSFEELTYDIATSMREAVERVAKLIGLEHYQTFALFERRTFIPAPGEEQKPDLHVMLDDRTRLGDVVLGAQDAKNSGYQVRLLFKKKIFRESDEQIEEPVFLQLSYLQAKEEYITGAYPVERKDAVKLCVLQIIEALGPGQPLTEADANDWCQSCIQKQLLDTKLSARADNSWAQEVLRTYQMSAGLNRDAARSEFLAFIRGLPYGNALFFPVQRHTDPLGLLPEQLQLGINKHGLHFFRPRPKEFLHSVELRDIMQFGSSTHAVFFKMRMAGDLQLFQFTTRQGDDICLALQTHIHDVLARKVRNRQVSTAGGASGHGSAGAGAAPSAAAMKQIKTLQREVEEWRSKHDALEAQLREEEDARKAAEHRATDATLTARGGANEEVRVLRQQVREAEARVMELEAQLSAAAGDGDAIVAMESRVKGLQEEAGRARKAEAAAEAARAALDEAKEHIRVLEGRLESEVKGAEARADGRIAALKAELQERRDKCTRLEQEVAGLDAAVASQKQTVEEAEKALEEMDALREEKKEVERKCMNAEVTVTKQAARLEELEALYKQEMTMRKRLHNTIEDMKGKIRVYARVRPILPHETKQGQSVALSYPDRFTLAHPWKDSKKPRTYEFDTVFTPNETQEQVFEDTCHLVQSALDGYNVCIFAYGQTGSGKTHTIYGTHEQPGLTPRAMHHLFDCVQRDSGKYAFEVRAHMLELYQDHLTDLLLPPAARTRAHDERLPRLDIKKDFRGMVTVHGATVVEVRSAHELLQVVERGLERRTVASTKMNRESSRSHLIITVMVTATNLQTQAVSTGKLSFVDLAGSERVKKSGSTGDQLKEAQAINKSLSALGDVISALASEQAHIPYRNHKLTMLMSDSLGGNAKTLMFVNVSPTDGNLDETQNSLQYATRARTIKNNVGRMEFSRDMLKLRRMIEYWKEQAAVPPEARQYVDLHSIMDERDPPADDRDDVPDYESVPSTVPSRPATASGNMSRPGTASGERAPLTPSRSQRGSLGGTGIPRPPPSSSFNVGAQ